ncbi:MAG: hypothetical protein IIV74_02520, partial [Alphaproteobacteria bacterium]|nr:hypothetical protein [Alphaproteobacteria bacterium]
VRFLLRAPDSAICFLLEYIPVGKAGGLGIILCVLQRDNNMHKNINQLCELMGLNKYQACKLKTHFERYNFDGLQNRGGVLYAPYVTHGFWQYVGRCLFGARADLIGKNSVLLRARRGIKFYANGYHSVRAGRYTYYADAAGRVVSRDEFLQNKSC